MFIDIEANSLQNAVNVALKHFMQIPDEAYLGDSFEVDPSIEEEYDGEFSLEMAIQSL